MRDRQGTIFCDFVDKESIEWLLSVRSRQRALWIYSRPRELLFEVLNNFLKVLSVRSQAKEYHIELKLFDTEILGGLAFTPVLKQWGHEFVCSTLKICHAYLIKIKGIFSFYYSCFFGDLILSSLPVIVPSLEKFGVFAAIFLLDEIVLECILRMVALCLPLLAFQ